MEEEMSRGVEDRAKLGVEGEGVLPAVGGCKRRGMRALPVGGCKRRTRIFDMKSPLREPSPSPQHQQPRIPRVRAYPRAPEEPEG